MRYILLALFLALVASSVTLWLIESPLKYALYVFQVVLIQILFYLISGKTAKIKLKHMENMTAELDYAFLATSTTLLVLTILKLDTVVTMVFAIIVSFFLPGYVLLRLLKFHSLESWIEWLVLSFALSIGLTSIIFTAMLPFTMHRTVLLSAIYVGVSLCPLLKDKIYKSDEKPEVCLKNRIKEYDLADVLLFLWITVFFVFAISSLYPQMSLCPGLDIVRHFSSSRLLTLAPEAYTSVYPWFHTTWANVYELSSPPMEVFQTGLAYLGVMIIFAFYVLTKAYLKDVDSRAPILATVFFSVFAGFGWLHFLKEKLAMSDSSTQLDMLMVSSDTSYMDIGYGQGSWLWFWFRPMTVAFTLFFVLLYLLSRKDIPKRKFIVVFSFLVVTLGLIHVPELILFNIFLLVLVLFMSQTPNLRLKEASLATLIGSVTYFSYASTSGMLGGVVKAPPIDMLLILTGTATVSHILAYRSDWHKIRHSSVSRGMRVVKVLTVIIALVFMAGLLTWFSDPNIFSFRYVSETYYIPLILYPVMLGIVGFFALPGLMVIWQKYRNNLAVVCVLLFLFTLVFGKLISFLNVEFIDLGYGEKRFLPVIFAAASMMASVSFLKQASRLLYEKKRVLLAISVTFIVITGITSMSLSIEYWDRHGSVSYYVLDAAEYLSSPFNRDIRTPILTASSATISLAEYIPSPYVVYAYRYPIWESHYPEAPLLILYNKYYLPPYLYLTQRDFGYISRYADGYFIKRMFQLLPKAYSNPEITVYRIPEGTPPSLHSSVLLVIPNDESADYLYAYDVLSLGQYEYTVCLISDVKTIASGKSIILPRDDGGYLNLLENLESSVEFQQGDKEIIIFNFNGLGPLANLFFKAEHSNEDIRATQIKRPNFTLNLPIEVDVPSLKEKEGISILAWYSNGKEQVPFAAELESENGKLVYINVYWIVKAVLKEEVATDPRYIMYLLMSELKDESVKDVSMNGNDGSVYAAKEVHSPFGISLDFDGKDSFIEVAHSDMLNPINEVTIEAWIKPRTPAKGFTIVSKKASYSSLDGYIFLFDGGTFYFNFGNGTNFFPNAFRYGRLEAERWYHLAVTYDGQHIKYYVNGAEAGSVEQSETIRANNLNILIGKRHDETWKLNGSIYKIVMYNKALTQSEIEERYNQIMAKFWTTKPTFQILGSVIQVAGVNLPAHVNYENWVHEGKTAFFKNASLKGHIVIKSSSFIEITINGCVNATILTEQEQVNMTHIKELYLSKADYGEIHSDGVTIHDGKGFYTRLTLVNPTLSFHGNVLITLLTSDQKTTEITFQNGQLTIVGELDVYARTPSIYVKGEAKFREMYSLFSLYRWLRSLGQDLTIRGTVEFQLTVSDVYNFASDMKWGGTISREPPILPWSEYNSIINMLPWLIILATLIVFWHTFFGKEHAHSKNR